MVREVGVNIRTHWISYMLIAGITAIGTSVGNAVWSRFSRMATAPEQIEELKVIVVKAIEDQDVKLTAAVRERNALIAKIDQDSKNRDDRQEAKYNQILSDHLQLRKIIPYTIRTYEEKLERSRRFPPDAGTGAATLRGPSAGADPGHRGGGH